MIDRQIKLHRRHVRVFERGVDEALGVRAVDLGAHDPQRVAQRVAAIAHQHAAQLAGDLLRGGVAQQQRDRAGYRLALQQQLGGRHARGGAALDRPAHGGDDAAAGGVVHPPHPVGELQPVRRHEVAQLQQRPLHHRRRQRFRGHRGRQGGRVDQAAAQLVVPAPVQLAQQRRQKRIEPRQRFGRHPAVAADVRAQPAGHLGGGVLVGLLHQRHPRLAPRDRAQAGVLGGPVDGGAALGGGGQGFNPGWITLQSTLVNFQVNHGC